MKLLIAYATNSGSTYHTTNIIKDVLEQNGHEVNVKCADKTVPQEIKLYDVFLIGSPSWKVNDEEGQPHETISELLEQISKENHLTNKPFAAFGCGDKESYLKFCQAVDIMEQKCTDLGGQKIADGLKVDAFYFQQEMNEELITEWAEQLLEKLPASAII